MNNILVVLKIFAMLMLIFIQIYSGDENFNIVNFGGDIIHIH